MTGTSVGGLLCSIWCWLLSRRQGQGSLRCKPRVLMVDVFAFIPDSVECLFGCARVNTCTQTLVVCRKGICRLLSHMPGLLKISRWEKKKRRKKRSVLDDIFCIAHFWAQEILCAHDQGRPPIPGLYVFCVWLGQRNTQRFTPRRF